MLTIKRCPTILSMNQSDSPGCGRNCLGECCVPGAKLPLYTFKRKTTLSEIKRQNGKAEEGGSSYLDNLLLGQWEDRMQKGLFRYDVTACETKLNEGRHLKKRPTEFCIDKVLQDFDAKKFNFTKVGQEEVLFRFEESEKGVTEFLENAPVLDSPNVIAINVSPIEYGHVLLVPRVLDCLPQRIDHDSFLLALHMAAEAANPSFRLGYNSLGAFATINHLHFQAYFMALPFPVEKAETKNLPWNAVKSEVRISELSNYAVRGLVFEGGHSIEDLANVVSNACVCLQDNNIPYNVLIADCGRRIFLFPQCYAEKQALGEVDQEILETQVNPAVWEISGHMVLKRKEDYERASEDYAWRLLAEVSLSEARFEEVKAYVLEAAGAETDDMKAEDTTPEDSGEAPLYDIEESHGAATIMHEECMVLQ